MVAVLLEMPPTSGPAIPGAVLTGLELVRNWSGHEATAQRLNQVLGATRHPTVALPATLGQGRGGPETLAIAIQAAVRNPDFRSAIAMAAHPSGDSDTTASLAGQFFGALHGIEALPNEWVRRLDILDALCDLADWSMKLWCHD
jgi:ADP-ribosylglycohydrolase